MVDSNQYLCLVLQGAEYLLPSVASVAIEQRHVLLDAGDSGPVVAWRQTRQGRWPAYGVDASFKPSRPADWERAVFLEADSQPVGFVAEEVHVLARQDVHVVPFVPLGPPPTRFGHFFNAAWVDGQKVTFVLDPRSLAGFLRGLGGAA